VLLLRWQSYVHFFIIKAYSLNKFQQVADGCNIGMQHAAWQEATIFLPASVAH
jgi:hypothetical protein